MIHTAYFFQVIKNNSIQFWENFDRSSASRKTTTTNSFLRLLTHYMLAIKKKIFWPSTKDKYSSLLSSFPQNVLKNALKDFQNFPFWRLKLQWGQTVNHSDSVVQVVLSELVYCEQKAAQGTEDLSKHSKTDKFSSSFLSNRKCGQNKIKTIF